jgi:hypothetical protein
VISVYLNGMRSRLSLVSLVVAALLCAWSTVSLADAFNVGGEVRDFVAGQLRRSHGRYGEGRMPVTDVDRHRGRGSSTLDMTVEVEAGQCYIVLAAGEPSVRAIRLDVRDAYANVRASAQPTDLPHARFCPDLSGTWIVSAKIEQGYGVVGAQVFGGTR